MNSFYLENYLKNNNNVKIMSMNISLKEIFKHYSKFHCFMYK